MSICKHCGIEHSIRGNQCRVCKDGLYRYGMTRVDMISLLALQHGKCAICSKELQLFSGTSGGFIDHCHKTNKVRGILCNRCNTNIGWLENLDKTVEFIYEYINRV